MERSNGKGFLDYLATCVAKDSVDFETHDRRYHGGLFDAAMMTCKMREALENGDLADVVQAEEEEQAWKDKQIQTEYDAVVARYTNADGTKEPGWMKAPNGEPTNLTERQWVQVRTPSFKKWFGDWEAVGWQRFLGSKPVAHATGHEFEGMSRPAIAEEMKRRFKTLGNEVKNAEIGKINLTNHGINDTMRKGIGREKLSAFPFVPEIVRGGRVVKWDSHWKNRDYDTAVIAAPIDIGGKPFAAFVVVRRYQNGDNNFYLHEVGVLEEVKAKARGLRSRLADSGKVDSSPDFIESIADIVYGVNPDSVSKVIDANGEPMVVWHGSPNNNEFTEFDKRKIHPKDGVKGFYFATPKRRDSVAGAYGEGKERPFFLSICRPIVGGPNDVPTKSQLAKHDGRIVRTEEDWDTRFFNHRTGQEEKEHLNKGEIIEIVAFEPTQIKSATDNSGEFFPESADTMDEKEECPMVTAAQRYLASVAEDVAPQTDMEKHDARFHPDGFDATKETCKFREGQEKGDKSDRIGDGEEDAQTRAESEYAEVVARYTNADGTKEPGWMKAPNGEPTNLTERQWVQVRTPSFKKWFGDWESLSEQKAMERRLEEWVSDEQSIAWAKGKSLLECEEHLGGKKEPIAYLPVGYLSHFSGKAQDNRIYTSKGYLLDHIANHKHNDVGAAEYRLLQQMFLSPDEVIKDTRPKPNGMARDSLLFVKRFSRNRLAAVELSERDGHIVLHKSLYNTGDRVYPSLPRVVLPEGGRSPISHAAEATPGGSLSARGGNMVSNYFEPVNPDSVSKIVDGNGEPKVVFHGTNKHFTTFDLGKSGRSNDTEAKVGFWFSESRDFADAFAKQTGDGIVLEDFLNIRKPKIYRKKNTETEQEALSKEIKGARERLKELDRKYDFADAATRGIFQLATYDDAFSRKLLAGLVEQTPDADSILRDAEEKKSLVDRDRQLTAELGELRHTDPYEQMRTDIAKTVGASAQEANFMGLGMAYSRQGEAAGLYRKLLASEGYDGIVIENTRFDGRLAGGDNTQIVAFEPTQIKSATGNSGAFSPMLESTNDASPRTDINGFSRFLKGN